MPPDIDHNPATINTEVAPTNDVGDDSQVVERGLTLREWKFVEAYLGPANGVATEAARIAGYGNTYRYHAVAASRLLTKDKIQTVISEQLEQHSLQAGMTIARLNQLLGASLEDYWAYDADGELILDDMGRPTFDLKRARRNGKLHLLESVKYTDNGLEIKLARKTELLALAAKIGGLIRDQVDVSVATDGDQVKRELIAKLMSARDKALALEGKGSDSAPSSLGGPTDDVVDVEPIPSQGHDPR